MLLRPLALLFISLATLNGTAFAGSVPLSDLVAGESISVGPLVFSNFRYSAKDEMREVEEILVVPALLAGDVGLRFVVDIDTALLSPFTANEAILGYEVEVIDPQLKITGSVSTAVAEGVGQIVVNRTLADPAFLGDDQGVLGRTQIGFASSGILDDNSVTFSPAIYRLNVSLGLITNPRTGSPSIPATAVLESFTDIYQLAIPEPSTLALITALSLPLATSRRLKSYRLA